MIYFIVNPIAGFGKAKAAVPIIEGFLNDRNEKFEVVYTEKPGDFARVSKKINLSKAKTVVCVGGDGTVQEYVGLCVNRDVNFGIIPVGSGNDFMYSMPDGMRKFRSFKEKILYHIKEIVSYKTMFVDVMSVNNERYCLNIGGTGMDIQILKDALPLKKFFGGASYFISLIKNSITYRAEQITLTIDGRVETERFLLLAMCNGAFYGGKLNIAPSAVINDGLMTVCKVKKMPRIKLAALFPLVKPGKHVGIKQVSFVECATITLKYKDKKTINLDGNLIEMKSPVTFEVLKGALRLIV